MSGLSILLTGREFQRRGCVYQTTSIRFKAIPFDGKTPNEYVMEKLKTHAINRSGNLPIKSVVDVS